MVRLDIALVVSLLPRLGHSGPVNAQCRTVHVRKEFRDLTALEWEAFRTAYLSLQNLPHPDPAVKGRSEWDYWTQMHIDHMMLAHNHPLFFPWHRAYILALEQRLQKSQPNLTLPYWDWTADYAAPLQSPIMRSAYGLDVQPNGHGDCRYQRALFQPHCLLRDYDPANFTTYYSPSALDAIIQRESDYDSFRRLIEMVPHAIIHTSLGGRHGDMAGMNSPNDPIFFIHHATVDYIWWIWQGLDPSRLHAYAGDTSAALDPFGIRISDVLDASRTCVTYQPYSGNPILRPRPQQKGTLSFDDASPPSRHLPRSALGP